MNGTGLWPAEHSAEDKTAEPVLTLKTWASSSIQSHSTEKTHSNAKNVLPPLWFMWKKLESEIMSQWEALASEWQKHTSHCSFLQHRSHTENGKGKESVMPEDPTLFVILESTCYSFVNSSNSYWNILKEKGYQCNKWEAINVFMPCSRENCTMLVMERKCFWITAIMYTHWRITKQIYFQFTHTGTSLHRD